MRRRDLSGLAALWLVAVASPDAFGGTFDSRGQYQKDPAAAAYLDFSSPPERYLPPDAEMKCEPPMFQIETLEDALDGTGALRLDVVPDCAERLLIQLPAEQGSYRATAWMRHGSLNARIVVEYTEASGLPSTVAKLFPTGRVTSDGWVELASNEFSVAGAQVERAYIRLVSFAGVAGVDLDAVEVGSLGEFNPQKACTGQADFACGPDAVCIAQQCVPGQAYVPVLPHDAIRDDMVDMLASRLRLFFGGRQSRAEFLPDALAEVEGMRTAKTAWQFWNGFATAVHRLHDWHTSVRGGPDAPRPPSGRLNACFFEGDADSSQGSWPKDPRYHDILVSHVGPDAAGLKPGDRLVAIDGVHPLDWVGSLIAVDWGFHSATDPDNFADWAERLGGPSWTGGGLILKYATSFTVIRCDSATMTCSDIPETVTVADLPPATGGDDIACDNRPSYHLSTNIPSESNHYVFWDIFRGPIADTTPSEAIFGMVWDNLFGGGDPNGYVNTQIQDATAEWKAGARGVILDHRAGNGGTLDAAENLTKLVRPLETAAVTRMPIEIAGDEGPADAAEGQAIFDKFKTSHGYDIGDPGHDPLLPVALILHRDGSASDYMPFGMKGAPKVRIFGPHATAGAFSTFIEFTYWNGLGFALASGDTIASTGQPLIGRGVAPDEVILPRQSDLLAGKDTLHEAALSWVRQELKP
jgi:hypothetical protein